MAELTAMQRNELLAQGKDILEQMTEGVHLSDIMSKIYVDNLEEKTTRQGEAIANAICAGVSKFDRDYREIQTNSEMFVDGFLKNTDAGSTGAERCTYWLRFSATIDAMMTAEDGNISEEVQDEISRMQVTDEMATAEFENELKQKAKDSILNSNILMIGLKQYEEQMEEAGSGNGAAEILLDFGSKEFDYRAVVAMIAYTKIKSGEYSNIAADITAEQVATLVCVEVERVRIAELVGNGEMSESTASKLFYLLGIVVICALAAYIIVGGLGLMGISLEGITLASTFTVRQILTIIGWIAISIGVFQEEAEMWESDHGVVFEKVKANGIKVVSGFRTMAKFAHDEILVKVSQKARSLWMEILQIWQNLRDKDTEKPIIKTEDLDNSPTIKTEDLENSPEEEAGDVEEDMEENPVAFA